jgi:hypothetical protein
MIVNTPFNSAETYVAEKVATIKAVVTMAWHYVEHDVSIYEDDSRVVFKLEQFYADAPVIIREVVKGELVAPEDWYIEPRE